jgi:hypothetical protein
MLSIIYVPIFCLVKNIWSSLSSGTNFVVWFSSLSKVSNLIYSLAQMWAFILESTPKERGWAKPTFFDVALLHVVCRLLYVPVCSKLSTTFTYAKLLVVMARFKLFPEHIFIGRVFVELILLFFCALLSQLES